MVKKTIAIVICIILIALTAACGKTGDNNSVEDNTITMTVALGNGEQYFTKLAEGIKENLGIDIKFVYQLSSDTTTFQRLSMKNNDVPADIVFTSSKTQDDYLKDSCLDLLSQTHLTSHFTYAKLKECTTDDGKVYQLPFTSKLIGITYNETLLNELGYGVPETFEDMVELKAVCDSKGIPFAVSDGVATGHGFNWLFHLMGSQWLSTIDGTEWLEKFLKGEASVDEFKEKCEYFKKWKEAGLFGIWNDKDWLGVDIFTKSRALFWFGLTNTISSYDGPQEETGKELHDVYKTMPWISEDGTNNCFTIYDNSWVMVNKELGEKGNEKKLENVIRILDYLASDEAIKLATDLSKDVYVSVNSFDMSEDRLYYSFSDDIGNGFLQPWYYNYFANDVIVSTGEVINSYISDNGADFDKIFSVLESSNKAVVNSNSEILFTAEEKLGYEETAKIIAVSGALGLQQSIDENGMDKTVQVSIVPYTANSNELPPWRGACVVNTLVYQGDFEKSSFNTIIPPNAGSPCGIYMTGKQIKEICDGKYNPESRFIDPETGKSSFDSENYGPYPYVCLTKDNMELKDNEEYLVCVSEKMLTIDQYQAFDDEGKIIDIASHTYIDGLYLFGEKYQKINKTNIVW